MGTTGSTGFAWYNGLPGGIECKHSYLDETRQSVSWFMHRLPGHTGTLSDLSSDPVISLELNADGIVEREIDGKWERAKLVSDTLTLTPAFAPCSWHWHGQPLEIIDVYIPYELMQSVWCDDFRGEIGSINFSPLLQFQDMGMALLLKSLLAATASIHSNPAILLETITQHIIVYLLGLNGTTTAGRTQTTSSLPLHILRRVRKYIEDRLGEDISLQDLANVADISKSHFLRQFREKMGVTPYAYLIERRVARGAQLLIGSSDSIGEVATRCGFNDPAHFARRFRMHYQTSPREFRCSNR